MLTWKSASRHSGVPSFHIRTSKNGTRPSLLLTFSLVNVLRVTAVCHFLTSAPPKVVRTWCVLYILSSKCASRHSSVQFFFSHLTREKNRPPNHWQNTVFCNFPNIQRTCIFVLLTLFSFSLLLFSSSLHIVGRFFDNDWTLTCCKCNYPFTRGISIQPLQRMLKQLRNQSTKQSLRLYRSCIAGSDWFMKWLFCWYNEWEDPPQTNKRQGYWNYTQNWS